jgi:hypothetical protein
MGYCTTTEVLARMGRPDTTTADARQNATDAIEAATAAIDVDCDRVFTTGAADVERSLVVVCNRPRLDIPDLISITTLKVDDTGDGTFSTTIDAADYELANWTPTEYVDASGDRQSWPYEMVTLLNRLWPTGRRRYQVQIDGTWGWPAVPAPINQACSILATRLMQRMSAAPFGIQNFGELGSQGIRSTDPDYLAQISGYRRVGVA